MFKQFAHGNVKPKLLEEFLTYLTPENCYILHKTKENAQLEDLKVEPIYGTQYKLVPFDKEVEWTAKWAAA